MRALFLTILAGGLGYLAYTTFQGDNPEGGVTLAEVTSEPTRPGQLLSRGSAPGPTTSDAGGVAPGGAGEAAPVSGQAPRKIASAADPRALQELAALLLQHPDQVEGWLLAGGQGRVGDARARLVRSFALALADRGPEAIQLAQGLNGVAGVSAAELAALRAAVTGKRDGVRAAAAGENVMASSMGVALHLRRALRTAGEGDHRAAAEAWSEVLLAAIELPWSVEFPVMETWIAGLNGAQAMHRLHPRGVWPSEEITVEPGDNLTFVRKRILDQHPELLICTGLLERVNHLGRYIQPGDVLRAPTERSRVLVDLSERLLLYLHGSEVVAAWTVGVGKTGEETPQGIFEVGEKERDPSWFPKGGAMVPFGHPDNPLGTRWLAWYEDGRKTGYGIHGTNDPTGVGGGVSRGCIRMRNGGVELLHDLLPLHSLVEVRP